MYNTHPTYIHQQSYCFHLLSVVNISNWETAISFSIAAVPFYLPAGIAPGCKCLHIHANTCHFLGFFDHSHPNGCEVVSYYSFDFHFPDDECCWASFHVLLAIYTSPLEKRLPKSFVHIFIGSNQCICHNLFIHSPGDGPLGCYWSWLLCIKLLWTFS